jgi:hypothetical protein
MTILSDNLVTLCEFLGTPITWRGMKIFEVGSSYDDHGRLRISSDQLLTPEAYSGRFDELLARGYAWVNLSCFGIYDGFMLVGVEVQSATTASISKTSVNYSGPPMSVLRHGWDASQALAIVA